MPVERINMSLKERICINDKAYALENELMHLRSFFSRRAYASKKKHMHFHGKQMLRTWMHVF